MHTIYAGQLATNGVLKADSLLSSLNTVLSSDESTSAFSFLPCTVNQNQWSTFLEGGTLSGTAGSATQGDALYRCGFARRPVLPRPWTTAFPAPPRGS